MTTADTCRENGWTPGMILRRTAPGFDDRIRLAEIRHEQVVYAWLDGLFTEDRMRITACEVNAAECEGWKLDPKHE